uniref:Uncharacterized protein n=1 Tax=Meloidogyne incognita TaxID=6306 RepID=A0A914MSE3_MELIC
MSLSRLDVFLKQTGSSCEESNRLSPTSVCHTFSLLSMRQHGHQRTPGSGESNHEVSDLQAIVSFTSTALTHIAVLVRVFSCLRDFILVTLELLKFTLSKAVRERQPEQKF